MYGFEALTGLSFNRGHGWWRACSELTLLHMVPVEAQSKTASTGLGPLGFVMILVLALLPSWGSLDAPFLAEDASILGRMADAGALDDWFQAQYGIENVVRFWRPLVSFSWWLQAQVLGTEAWPARLLGLLVHAGTALVLGRLLLAFGASRWAALFGAAMVASFVHQGGTVTWMAGRTDLMVGLGMLLTLWSALRERRLAAIGFAFLACSCKEFGFLLPLWVAALLWARGWSWSALLRGSWPVLAACALAYLWRTLALGVWDGGYPLGGSQFGAQLLPGLLNLARTAAPALAACALLCTFGFWRGSLHGRLAIAGLVCAFGAALPIVPLSASLPLEEANERLILVASLGLAITLAASLARAPSKPQPAWLPLVLVLPWTLWCSWQAFEDTQQWTRAAELAGMHESRARELCADLSASEHPVLVAGLPRNTDGAYCLGLGFSDRFRAPFETTPRPIWPLRTMFEVNLRERDMLRVLHAGELLLPFESLSTVPEIACNSPELDSQGWLLFDQRVLDLEQDRSEQISLSLPQIPTPSAMIAVVYTELGYGSVRLPLPAAPSISLRQLIGQQEGGHNLAEMLSYAADLGGLRSAYLELRIVDASGQALAATPWIETRWGPDFLASIGR